MGHFQCLLLVGSDFRQAVLDASVQGLFEWNSSVKLDSRVADGFTGVWSAPISRASRAAFLAPFGLDLDWGDRLQVGGQEVHHVNCVTGFA